MVFKKRQSGKCESRYGSPSTTGFRFFNICTSILNTRNNSMSKSWFKYFWVAWLVAASISRTTYDLCVYGKLSRCFHMWRSLESSSRKSGPSHRVLRCSPYQSKCTFRFIFLKWGRRCSKNLGTRWKRNKSGLWNRSKCCLCGWRPSRSLEEDPFHSESRWHN